MVKQSVRDAGKNIMIGSGGGIHAHPANPIAGAKAFRQAIDAAMKGVEVKQHAKENNLIELQQALGIWKGKTEFHSI